MADAHAILILTYTRSMRHLRDDVGVLELSEHGDLTESSRGDALVLNLQTNALQSDNLVTDLVASLVDDAVGALTHGAVLLDLLIAVHFCIGMKWRLLG